MKLYELYDREQRVRAKVEKERLQKYFIDCFDQFYKLVETKIYDGKLGISNDSMNMTLKGSLRLFGFDISQGYFGFTKTNLKLLEKLRKKYGSKSK